MRSAHGDNIKGLHCMLIRLLTRDVRQIHNHLSPDHVKVFLRDAWSSHLRQDKAHELKKVLIEPKERQAQAIVPGADAVAQTAHLERIRWFLQHHLDEPGMHRSQNRPSRTFHDPSWVCDFHLHLSFGQLKRPEAQPPEFHVLLRQLLREVSRPRLTNQLEVGRHIRQWRRLPKTSGTCRSQPLQQPLIQGFIGEVEIVVLLMLLMRESILRSTLRCD
mmetsp:Transcript_45246/g.105865  ORF Transcript_45246/g.105865 Transcript_45246/m.105865 type:complete len:218 (+) Transcript_45246:1062-1715(+)